MNTFQMIDGLGILDFVEVEELTHGNLYLVPEIPVEIGIGVGRGALAIGIGDAVSHARSVLSGGDPGSAAENKALREVLREHAGAPSISVVDFEMFATFMEIGAAESGGDVEGLFDDVGGTLVMVQEAGDGQFSMRVMLR